MPDDPSWLPLFPLNTVLFPDGILPLRVFDARYIDMVRDCMKRAAPFGVALIKSGKEVGAAAVPEAVGCIAHIEQWDMADLGVLLLRTRGGARLRILETRLLPAQRLEARIELLAADAAIAFSGRHMQCAAALKIVIDEVHAKAPAGQSQAEHSPFAQPVRLDDAAWVANRWCEILPIPLKARQKLLELDDAQHRREIVHQYLQQHGIL